MRIDAELAAQIQSKARPILNRDIMIADEQGKIMTSQSHQGQFIADALKAAQESAIIDSALDHRPIKWFPFVYEGQSVGAFGLSAGDKAVTEEIVSLLQGLSEVLLHQHFLLERIQSPSVVRAEFLREVLSSSNLNPDEVFRQADILQLDLRSSQAVILAKLEGFEGELHSNVSHLSPEEQRLQLQQATETVCEQIKRGFKNYQDNIVAYGGKDIFLFLKGIGGEGLNTLNTTRFLNEKANYVFELLSKLHPSKRLTVGVGQYYPDLGGLRKSYQEAELALDVGLKVWGPGRVYHIKQVGMFTALTNVGQERKAELAHQILHPLLRDKQLYKTVRTFLANGLSLTEAASKLHIHRNTLIYRLDKTKKLINLDPRVFDDALQIKLGLVFYQE
jgi:carbohydrate diacid regulator